MAIQVTRTYVGDVQNHQQVQSDLDSLGDAASKIWNVARWTVDRVWEATGEIPDEGTLKAYMKAQHCWKNLNAFSSQKVIEELSDAFQSWFDVRHKDETANPPATAKSTTLDRAQQSRSRTTASSTTPNITESGSVKVQT